MDSLFMPDSSLMLCINYTFVPLPKRRFLKSMHRSPLSEHFWQANWQFCYSEAACLV